MTNGEKWIKLLGYYAVHEDGDSKAIYHERLERLVAALGIPPLEFTHPKDDDILATFKDNGCPIPNVFLAGEAGVGKTRIVHKIYSLLGGSPSRLKANGHYWCHEGVSTNGDKFKIHFNRDLSAWRKFGAKAGAVQESDLMLRWSALILGEQPDLNLRESFVIAANDGQLLKAWQDHSASPKIKAALDRLQSCLRAETSAGDTPLPKLFHLSSIDSRNILRLCLDALIQHPGWNWLLSDHSKPGDLFCERSPLRRNYEALKDPIIRSRLEDLAMLCEANEWHLPIRNILTILANALLGVSDRKISQSGVMEADHIRKLMAEDRPHASSFFANILGLNLSQAWRELTLGPIDSFRIGLETFNQADNLILFGPEDSEDKALEADYQKIFANDPVFPPDSTFEQFRARYLSVGPQAFDEDTHSFQEQLIAQRRRLFFRTPADMEAEYNPWGLSNFQYAKGYLEHILTPTKAQKTPHNRELAPLVLGLNRVWTGLLLDEQDTLFVTTALDFANGRSAEIEVRRIPTKASSGGDYPFIDWQLGKPGTPVPKLAIYLSEADPPVTLALTLTRFEFLRRVAAGALPASFSRECAEDIRAFKSRIIARLPVGSLGSLKLIHVNPDGTAGKTALNLNSH
jgi:hypothetical protein